MSAKFKNRFEAVFLVSHPKGPQMSVRGAAKYLRKSVGFVQEWNKRYAEVGNVDNYTGRGSKRVTSKREDKAIVRLFSKKPNISLRAAKAKLAKSGIQVSLNTLRNRLRESGISHRSTMPKPLLTQNHIAKRLTWARDNINRDWTKVMFTDESSFWLNQTHRRVWAKQGERVVVRTVKHPAKVHVWGCFCSNGFGRLITFTGTLNAERMIKLYQKGLLPSSRKLFGPDNDDWVLQEDNDPKHCSRLCSRWKTENSINRMDWPAQSPDANPIENVWALMKLKLQGKQFKNTRQFRNGLLQIWRNFSTEYAKKLSESCTRRCEAIIQSGGDWTNY